MPLEAAHSERMGITDSYLNFAFWALGLICAVGIGVAVWIS
jgi:hypothetical protein